MQGWDVRRRGPKDVRGEDEEVSEGVWPYLPRLLLRRGGYRHGHVIRVVTHPPITSAAATDSLAKMSRRHGSARLHHLSLMLVQFDAHTTWPEAVTPTSITTFHLGFHPLPKKGTL